MRWREGGICALKNNNVLEYKGYQAEITFNADTEMLHGVIADIMDHVDFLSPTAKGIEEEFHKAVDDYLSFCEQVGKEPDQPYKGVFQVRTSPETHRKLVQEARRKGIALNSLVDSVLKAHVAL